MCLYALKVAYGHNVETAMTKKRRRRERHCNESESIKRNGDSSRLRKLLECYREKNESKRNKERQEAQERVREEKRKIGIHVG